MARQIKFYKWALVVMFSLNIIILGVIVWMQAGETTTPSATTAPTVRPHFREEAAQILHLSAEQRPQFIELTIQHNQQMLSIERKLTPLLKDYFKQLSDETGAPADTVLFSKIQALEAEKIEVTYQHFEAVKALLHEDQLPYYETFMNRALEVLLSSTKKPPHPPKGMRP